MKEGSAAGEARRPRVLVFAHSSGMAGAERSLLETLRLLAGSHEIGVVVPTRGPFSDAVRALPGARVHVVHQHSWYQEPGRARWKKLAKAALALSAVVRSVLLLARTRPDLAYSNSVASWTGAIASRLAGVPHVWHLRELPLREHPGEPIFGRRLERWLLSDPRCVLVCNSGFVRDWYQGTFGRAPAVAYQPVSVPSVAARAARSGVHVAVLGRLHPAKRQHLVVEAVARLPAELRERLQVHLHGEPIEPYATQLQALVDARGLQATVHLHGFTPSPHQALADCDLVVLPSVGEAFGRACAEAMLLGVPVIGADSGGTLELIGAAGSKGRLFRTDDADALSACIASFLRDPAPFRQRAAAARDWAREALAEDAYLETLRSAFASARGK